MKLVHSSLFTSLFLLSPLAFAADAIVCFSKKDIVKQIKSGDLVIKDEHFRFITKVESFDLHMAKKIRMENDSSDNLILSNPGEDQKTYFSRLFDRYSILLPGMKYILNESKTRLDKFEKFDYDGRLATIMYPTPAYIDVDHCVVQPVIQSFNTYNRIEIDSKIYNHPLMDRDDKYVLYLSQIISNWGHTIRKYVYSDLMIGMVLKKDQTRSSMLNFLKSVQWVRGETYSWHEFFTDSDDHYLTYTNGANSPYKQLKIKLDGLYMGSMVPFSRNSTESSERALQLAKHYKTRSSSAVTSIELLKIQTLMSDCLSDEAQCDQDPSIKAQQIDLSKKVEAKNEELFNLNAYLRKLIATQESQQTKFREMEDELTQLKHQLSMANILKRKKIRNKILEMQRQVYLLKMTMADNEDLINKTRNQMTGINLNLEELQANIIMHRKDVLKFSKDYIAMVNEASDMAKLDIVTIKPIISKVAVASSWGKPNILGDIVSNYFCLVDKELIHSDCILKKVDYTSWDISSEILR